MLIDEARKWLQTEGYVRCKEINSDLLYDAMLWEEDAVFLRQSSPTPTELYIISMDVFAKRFSALGD